MLVVLLCLILFCVVYVENWAIVRLFVIGKSGFLLLMLETLESIMVEKSVPIAIKLVTPLIPATRNTVSFWI